MSVACGVECVVCFGCSRWAWKRLTYIGSYDSESWPLGEADDFEPVPRACRAILAIYEDDLSQPRFPPAGGYRMDPSAVFKRATYSDTQGQCPPYLIYTDVEHKEIILAIRGLNLSKESDYKVLLDNRLGMQMFDGGFVHCGLLKAATWLLNQEADALRRLWLDRGPEYRLVIAGHSLGSGIAALMSIIVVNHRDRLGGIPRSHVRCYAIAPARCTSLNLAVKYADVIHSVVLQDDFLPRTATPLEYIFGSIFCLPCFLFLVCLRDTFIPERRKLKDPRRLYAPGRMYHIVERKFCRCGRFPPEVRTAIPVEGRFEHIVLSCNTTSDHGIIWIEREAQKALDRIRENAKATTPPPLQKMERKQTFEKEHKDALERAVTLNVPHAVQPTEASTEEDTSEGAFAESQKEETSRSNSKSSGRPNWNELVEKLFDRSESGNLVLKEDANVAVQ
ncbi:Feruloyl esterase protein [Dioscorea alata]|uniref:Feruloyl esterase protein n=1 Tax=Dioscorea alata TaxID=55571 RepID=A0ACB7VYJ8_DIOAL|nr:Feruloyl esterase protein [Dioscorea alata]